MFGKNRKGGWKWGKIELRTLTAIFAYGSEASPEGPKEWCPIVRCGLYKAEFPEENVSSLAYAVKTRRRKKKNSSLDENQKAGSRMER